HCEHRTCRLPPEFRGAQGRSAARDVYTRGVSAGAERTGPRQSRAGGDATAPHSQESSGSEGLGLVALDEAGLALRGRALGSCLQAGDVVLLHGPMGAGKTTLTRAIAVG